MSFANYTGGHTRPPSSTRGAVTGCQGPKQKAGGKKQRGGYGYGLAKNSDPVGQGGPNGVLAPFNAYKNIAVENPANLNASKAKAYPTQSGGNSHTVAAEIPSGTTYYRSGGESDGNYGIYAGSGYPPISKALSHGDCSQSGGRKSKSRRKTKRSMRKRSMRKRKGRKSRSNKRTHCRRRCCTKSRGRRSRKSRRSSKKKLFRSPKIKYLNQSGGYTQYQSNVPLSFGYAQGAPPNLTASQSMLANPPPTTRYNNCPSKN